MKKYIQLVMGLLVVFSLTQCKKDTEEYEDLQLSVKEISVDEDKEASFNIEKGSGDYAVTSSNESIAKATLAKNSVKVQGIAAGNAKISVQDKKSGQALSVAVVVNKKIPAITIDDKTSLEPMLTEGGTQEFPITAGSGEYTVVVDNDKVTASIKDGKLTITAVKTGSSKVTVSDKKTGAKVVLTVTVEKEIPPVTIDGKTEVAISLKEKEVKELTITAGSGDYKIAVDNTNATALVKDGKVVISAHSVGKAKVALTDNKTTKTAVVNVTVDKEIPPVTIDGKTEVAISLKEKEVKELTITAGSGDYKIAVDNANATAEVKSGKVVITAKTAGKAKVTLTDNKTTKTAVVNVTIEKEIPPVTIDGKTELAISLKEKEVKELTITAGSGDYSIAVDNANATASFAGKKIIIEGKKAGTAKVTLTDNITAKTAIVNVTITPATIAVTSVEIEGSSKRFIQVGKTLQLNAIVKPDNATNKGVDWSSGYSDVAAVNATSGLVNGQSYGSAIITAKSNDNPTLSAWREINVIELFDVKKTTVTEGKQISLYYKNGKYSNQLVIATNSTSGIIKTANIASEELTVTPAGALNIDKFTLSSGGGRVYLIEAGSTLAEATVKMKVTFTSGDVFERTLQVAKPVLSAIPASHYELSTDGKTLVKWLENSTTVLDMEADPVLKNVTIIGEKAFKDHPNLTKLNTPKGLKSLGLRAFADCSKLNSVTLHNQLTHIYQAVFADTNLSTLNIPNSVTFIWADFISNTNIAHITIPASVQILSYSAFSFSPKLKTITFLGNTPPKDDAFGDALSLWNSDNVTDIYVPASAVEAYKAAPLFRKVKDKIKAKP